MLTPLDPDTSARRSLAALGALLIAILLAVTVNVRSAHPAPPPRPCLVEAETVAAIAQATADQLLSRTTTTTTTGGPTLIVDPAPPAVAPACPAPPTLFRVCKRWRGVERCSRTYLKAVQ